MLLALIYLTPCEAKRQVLIGRGLTNVEELAAL